MKNTVLEVQNLNSFYTEKRGTGFHLTKKRIQILKDVSFDIKEGEVLALVGESGCGKTTLSKAILGFIKDYDGNIIHHSERPQMIFQDPYSSLNPSRKIGWLMEEPLKNKGGFHKAERVQKVAEMLQKVGLSPEIAERYPDQLSGGQRQRVCIGIALMLEPKLLIADEPVSALDVTIQAQVMKLLLDLQKSMNLSILFISHDLRVVYQMCQNVMIMKEGEIVEKGSVEEIYFSPKHAYTKVLLEAAGVSGI